MQILNLSLVQQIPLGYLSVTLNISLYLDTSPSLELGSCYTWTLSCIFKLRDNGRSLAELGSKACRRGDLMANRQCRSRSTQTGGT